MFLPHQVTVYASEPTTDSRGNVVRRPSATPVAVRGFVQPAATAEDRADGQRRVTGWRCLLPLGTVVDAWSVLEWGGTRFELDGDPYRWDTPSGPHLTAPLRRVGG